MRLLALKAGGRRSAGPEVSPAAGRSQFYRTEHLVRSYSKFQVSVMCVGWVDPGRFQAGGNPSISGSLMNPNTRSKNRIFCSFSERRTSNIERPTSNEKFKYQIT
ncbi:MAG: hypothetical protein CVU64_17825 [Deltaproteobacteria bacterium HGW-Deltaproteobacteria-21]|nr:MAG: hypothetical protein CVU64_17825 [Deltaproteobacteria bacterium HGW-Deltaproteobacteria-21]